METRNTVCLCFLARVASVDRPQRVIIFWQRDFQLVTCIHVNNTTGSLVRTLILGVTDVKSRGRKNIGRMCQNYRSTADRVRTVNKKPRPNDYRVTDTQDGDLSDIENVIKTRIC